MPRKVSEVMRRNTIAQPIALVLEMAPISKARPRVTANGTYMPSQYQSWMRAATAIFSSQWHYTTLAKVSKLEIQLYGRSGRADLDNTIGSVLDAMVKAGILRNDSMVVVPHIECAWERSTDPRIEVYIYGGVPV